MTKESNPHAELGPPGMARRFSLTQAVHKANDADRQNDQARVEQLKEALKAIVTPSRGRPKKAKP